MKTMKSKLFSVAVGLLTAFGGAERLYAATGDAGSPDSFTVTSAGSKTVTLLEDPASGDYVYWFRTSIDAGQVFTVWASSGKEIWSTGLYLDTAETEEAFSGLWSNDTYSPNTYRLMVDASEWSDEPSGKYYLRVTGTEANQQVTVNWSPTLVAEAIPVGVAENPKRITVGTALASASGVLYEDWADGAYYFETTLTAGSKYKFVTSMGNANNSLDILFDPDSDLTVTEVVDADDYNMTYVVVPQVTQTYTVIVTGTAGASFKLEYQVVPKRAPSAHAFTTLTAPTPAGADYDCEPNARNNPASGFYDPVIDEQLYKVRLEKDAFYVFETFDAAASDGLVMEIYDSAGTVLLANRQKEPYSSDVKIVFKAPAAADYWLGVCQDVEEPSESVTCTLNVRKVGSGESGLQDAYDTGDDVWSGASGLAPLPGATGELGVAHGLHTLGLTDFADWFRLDVRQGIRYEFRAVATNDTDKLSLGAKVYTVSGTSLTLVQTIANLAEVSLLSPNQNGSFYILVYVNDGQGVDYAYNLHSVAYKTGTQLGLLQVTIGGPTTADGASWSLVSDGTAAPKYPGGATILLPAGQQTVKFNPVTNWSTPANQNVTVNAGTEPTVISANYNDTFDPKDDVTAGATALTPSGVWQKTSRSLWTTDLADWFKLTVKTDSYYSFRLNPLTGAPTVTIYRTNLIDQVAAGTDIRFLAREAGTYYVKLGHANPSAPSDSAYTLNYRAQAVGVIQFEKAAYTFKEGLASADVKVLRSAKDGRVRVRYETVAGTAVPGVNYKPVKGYLDWPDGNTAAKTISVPLIPNLKAAWDLDKTFSVRLEVVPADEVEDGELVPSLGALTSTLVTITEITKKAPGKITFSGYGPEGGAVLPFANPAKPAVIANAGDWVTFWVARSSGADGVVAVKAETVKGTALADVNFEYGVETLVWEAGDLSPKPFTVRTLATEAYQPEKAMTVKLTVDATLGGTASLGVSTATVQIRDPLVDRTAEEWLASEDKPAGVTGKPGAAGAWFFGWDGCLRSIPLAAAAKAEFSLSVTGPGTLTFAPELLRGAAGDNSTFKYAIGTQTFTCEDGATIVRYLPKGAQTVKFTVTRGSSSPADAEVYGRFGLVNGQPFAWTPLPVASLVSPSDKAIIDLGVAGDFFWQAPGVPGFRITVADSAANLLKQPMITEVTTTSEFCTSCGDYPSFEEGKTYYWRVDSVIFGEDPAVAAQDKLINTNVVWSFTVAAAGVPQTEQLVVDDLSLYQSDSGVCELVQGLAYKIGPFSDDTNITFKATGLPAGLALTVVSGRTYLTGVPTGTNAVTATLQASRKSGLTVVAGTTASLPFVIEPLGVAAGTFNGLLNANPSNQNEAVGSVAFTATEAGKLSAKVLVAGKTYSFAGTGYTQEIAELENGLPGLLAHMDLKTTVGTKAYTNTLFLTVCRGPATDPDRLESVAVASLKLWIPATNGLSARAVEFDGELVRDNSKVASVTNGLKPLVGYHTVSLVVQDVDDGNTPNGAGYVTVTVDAKAGVKLSGLFPDGSVWSGSTVAGYVSNFDGEGAPALFIPVYTAKALMAASGWIVITLDESSGLPVARGNLDWYNADFKATRDVEEGFALWLEAAGGYYDTLFSLQTYYLNSVLTVGEITGLDAMDATYTQLLCTPSTYGLAVNVIGDTLTTDKRLMAKDATQPTLNDFEASTNACNVVFTFKRATGIFSGTFSLWYGNDAETLQKELAGLKFQGLLSPVKSSDSQYFNSPGLGFYQIPEKIGTRTWTGSHLFEIKAEEVVPDWTEGWED